MSDEPGRPPAGVKRDRVGVFLHGFGSGPAEFASHWRSRHRGRAIFLEGPERDPWTGGRRWFPFTGDPGSTASGLDEAVGHAAVAIGDALRQEGLESDSDLDLVGHSQGAMVALCLADRRLVSARSVHAYAGYLPSLCTLGARARIVESPDSGGARIYLYCSNADPYIDPSRVVSTARHFRTVHGFWSRVWESPWLPHTFSAAWLDSGSYSVKQEGR